MDWYCHCEGVFRTWSKYRLGDSLCIFSTANDAPGYVVEFDGKGPQDLSEHIQVLDGGAYYFGPYAVGGCKSKVIVWRGRHSGGRNMLGGDLTNADSSPTRDSQKEQLRAIKCTLTPLVVRKRDTANQDGSLLR